MVTVLSESIAQKNHLHSNPCPKSSFVSLNVRTRGNDGGIVPVWESREGMLVPDLMRAPHVTVGKSPTYVSPAAALGAEIFALAEASDQDPELRTKKSPKPTF